MSERGRELRRLRQQAGLSQVELARRLGIVAPVLSAYERGRREPRVDVFFRAVHEMGFRIEFVPRRGIELAVPDAHERAVVLVRVCGLGMALPRRDRGPLRYPRFADLAGVRA